MYLLSTLLQLQCLFGNKTKSFFSLPLHPANIPSSSLRTPAKGLQPLEVLSFLTCLICAARTISKEKILDASVNREKKLKSKVKNIVTNDVLLVHMQHWLKEVPNVNQIYFNMGKNLPNAMLMFHTSKLYGSSIFNYFMDMKTEKKTLKWQISKKGKESAN